MKSRACETRSLDWINLILYTSEKTTIIATMSTNVYVCTQGDTIKKDKFQKMTN